MPTQDDIDKQRQRLERHRDTLAHYLDQRAQLGTTYEPPTVSLGIAEARAAIARLKATLRGWGVAVEDHPDDGEQPVPPAREPAPAMRSRSWFWRLGQHADAPPSDRQPLRWPRWWPIGLIMLLLIAGAATFAWFTWPRPRCPTLIPYDQALQLRPDDPQAYYNRGVAYSSRGAYDCAIEDFDQAIKRQADYSAAYTGRGSASYLKGDYDQAIKDLTQALNRQPRDAEAYLYRGAAYRATGDNAGAIDDLTQAITLHPSNARAYFHRGWAYQNLNEYGKAIDNYSQAITFKPDYGWPYNGRGQVYYQIGDDAKAISDLTQAINLLLPNEKDWAYYYRGLAYSRSGNRENAIADFKTVTAVTQDTALREKANAQLKRLDSGN